MADRIIRVEIHVSEPQDGGFAELPNELEVTKVVADGKEITNTQYNLTDTTDWVIHENEAGSNVIAVTQLLTC